MRYKKIEGSKKLSHYIKPMLAQLYDGGPFDDDDWVFELKWDGYRAVAEVKDKTVRLYSRNGLSFDQAYRKVYNELQKIKQNVVFDGEIVVFDSSGQPSFQLLQNYTNSSDSIIHFFIFDCLTLNGRDLTSLPLLERKAILEKLIPPKSSVLRYCDHVVGSGKEFFHEVQKTNFEGMIAKRSSSKYFFGKRTSDWLKIKNIKSEEAVIVGFTAPKGSRIGFGSLLLAQYHKGKLFYIGNVGTGFNDSILKTLHSRLKAIALDSSPLDIPIKPPAHTTWVMPQLVCNINFTEKTVDGMVRHPVFQGLRIDKTAIEVSPEKATGKRSGEKKKASEKSPKPKLRSK